MMRGMSWTIGLLVALLASVGAAGGASPATSEAQAASSVAYTSQGAAGNVEGGIDDVTGRALDVLHDKGINVVSTLTGPADSSRVIEGRKGEMSLRVTMSQMNNNLTYVQIQAQKIPYEWDKDYAAKLVKDIAKS